jgi:hypothetical protein
VTHAFRTFAVLAGLAVAPGMTVADSGRAADRAGQKAEANRATQDFQREIRAERLARWWWQMSRCRLTQQTRFCWDWDTDEFGWDRTADADAPPPR